MLLVHQIFLLTKNGINIFRQILICFIIIEVLSYLGPNEKLSRVQNSGAVCPSAVAAGWPVFIMV